MQYIRGNLAPWPPHRLWPVCLFPQLAFVKGRVTFRAEKLQYTELKKFLHVRQLVFPPCLPLPIVNSVVTGVTNAHDVFWIIQWLGIRNMMPLERAASTEMAFVFIAVQHIGPQFGPFVGRHELVVILVHKHSLCCLDLEVSMPLASNFFRQKKICDGHAI